MEKRVTDVIDGAEYVRTTETSEGTAVLTYFGENKVGIHCADENGTIQVLNSTYVDIGYDNFQNDVCKIMNDRIKSIEAL